MNGLYPIIRRVRRPLVPMEAPAGVKPETASTRGDQAEALGKDEQPEPKKKHGEATSTKPAK